MYVKCMLNECLVYVVFLLFSWQSMKNKVVSVCTIQY